MFEQLNVNIHIIGVLKACKELNTGKSAGPDLMSNVFFIYGTQNIIFGKYLIK